MTETEAATAGLFIRGYLESRLSLMLELRIHGRFDHDTFALGVYDTYDGDRLLLYQRVYDDMTRPELEHDLMDRAMAECERRGK